MRGFWMALVVAVALVAAAFALEDQTLPVGGSFYDGPTLQPQTDSAATDTVTTAYTPRFIGDFLIGKTGGSNSLWVGVALATSGWSVVTTSGGPFNAADLAADSVTEAALKAVDTASDEDFLTYESTTGDFEWHSAADKAGTIAAAITEGQLANSIVVSADIKDGEVANADVSASAAIAMSKLNTTSGTWDASAATNLAAGSIASGNLAAARLPTTAVVTDGANLLTEGYFDVLDTTQLVFRTATMTNVIDGDITTN